LTPENLQRHRVLELKHGPKIRIEYEDSSEIARGLHAISPLPGNVESDSWRLSMSDALRGGSQLPFGSKVTPCWASVFSPCPLDPAQCRDNTAARLRAVVLRTGFASHEVWCVVRQLQEKIRADNALAPESAIG
jgi:hypothetical protein